MSSIDDGLTPGADVDTDLLEAQRRGARRAAGRDEQLRGAELAVTGERDDLQAIAAHSVQFRFFMHRDSVRGEGIAKHRGYLGFLAARDSRSHEDRDASTKVREKAVPAQALSTICRSSLSA